MTVRYATVAMTGPNNPSRHLRSVDEDPASWDDFADAKAAVITRADVLREFLESSGCSFQTRSVSGESHYEVSFEYGPGSLEPALPFKMVLLVQKRTVGHRSRRASPGLWDEAPSSLPVSGGARTHGTCALRGSTRQARSCTRTEKHHGC